MFFVDNGTSQTATRVLASPLSIASIPLIHPLNKRRAFLGILPSGLALLFVLSTGRSAVRSTVPEMAVPATGASVGNLYPLLQKLAVPGEFPLSWLRAEFTDLAA